MAIVGRPEERMLTTDRIGGGAEVEGPFSLVAEGLGGSGKRREAAVVEELANGGEYLRRTLADEEIFRW